MDIPRIFNITESAHRIHNPFTPEKLATLGAALRRKRGPSARPRQRFGGDAVHLGTRLRSHRHRHRHEPVVHRASELRAEELGVAHQVKFIHGDAAGYVSDDKAGVAACLGATWIAGGVIGTIELLARSLRPGGSSSSANPTGGGYRRRKTLPRGVLPAQSPTFSRFQNFSVSATSAMTSWKWFWYTKTAGTDTRRLNERTMRRWLEANPDDEFAKDVRAKLTSEPERHAAYSREYLGWGVCADDALRGHGHAGRPTVIGHWSLVREERREAYYPMTSDQ